jgi:hypothetical protein
MREGGPTVRADRDYECAYGECVRVVVAWLDGAAWCGHHAREVLERGARPVLNQAVRDANVGKPVPQVQESGHAA